MVRGPAGHLMRTVLLAALITGCVSTGPAPRVIHDANELLVRLEPAQTCAGGVGEPPFSHPKQLSGQQTRTLLASLLAREKVGLLHSFVQAPGTPPLFDEADLDRLTPSIQEGFAQANSEEVVVFLLTRPASDSRSMVTSGALAIRGEVLSIALFNFRHPVHTTLSDIGATDRLSDVRETLQYVRTSPCISIGEQDFALFFKKPTYQMHTRSGSLVRYPERALSIPYAALLSDHARPSRNTDGEPPLLRPTSDRAERQTIEDLTRRIAELEQANQALAVQSHDKSGSGVPIDPPTSAIDKKSDPGNDTQQRLLELIQQLEIRISELERQRQAPSPR